MTKTKTMTKKMTALYFKKGYYGDAQDFLGLDARPKHYEKTLFTAVASPAQITKVKRAIADGVRYEVKHVKGNAVRPDTVRVRTHGTHKEEVRQEIREVTARLVQQCLSAVDEADRLAGDDANPLPPRFHKERVLRLEHNLNWFTKFLFSRVCGYVDPAFMKYPRRGRKSPSTP